MKEHSRDNVYNKVNKNSDVEITSGDTTNAYIKNRGIWKRFFHTCAVAKLPYFFILFYIVINVLQGMILVKIPQVNANFFSGDVSAQGVAMFIGMEMLSMVICQFVLYIDHIVRAKTNRNLRNALWGKILKLKPKYFDKVSAGTLISRITVDSDSINEFVMDIVLEAASQIYMLILTINEMSKISIRAGLILLAFLPLSLIITFVMGRMNLRFENSMKLKMSDLTNYLSELMSCLPLVKAFNRQAYESRRGRKVIDDYYKANRNVIGLDVIKQIVGILFGIGPEICIILFGIKMLNEGVVDSAGWYTFYLYAGTFIGFCSTMGGIWERAKAIQGKLNKVSDVLYEDEEGITPYVSEIVDAGDIIFDGVDFSYENEPMLKDVSFTIPSNKITAIIGYSGSGKSTILKLLERLYEPEKGRILMSGREIRDYSVREWRGKIAYVTQNTPLMSGSVRENMLYGIRHEIDDKEIMEAAALAHVDGFIRENPEGLEAQVGQFGSKISGGQRQKISIARALLTNARLLVLDEPTANLDIISTNEIVSTVNYLKGKRTVVIATHNAAILKSADHIVVVDKDHSVIEGSDGDMRLMSDFYCQLMKE